MAKQPKNTTESMISAMRKAAAFRNEVLATGISDDAGAIYSIDCLAEWVGARLNYPGLSHNQYYRKYPAAEFSVEARAAYQRGKNVFIEHVAPRRAFARAVCALVAQGVDDQVLVQYIRENYRLVLLSQEETTRLNRQNRSRMTPSRLEDAGIVIESPAYAESLAA